MLGILPERNNRMTLDFKKSGDMIFLLGESVNDINSSEYLYSYHKVKNTPAPYFDLQEEFAVQDFVKTLIKRKIVNSAHDVSDGGLFINLLESAIPRNLGFSIATDFEIRKDAFLFGEAQSRIVVTVDAEHEELFMELALDSELAVSCIGEVTDGELLVNDESFGSIAEYKHAYENTLGNHLN
jgi:phosphoribosylformylglycinamidine synthase